MSSEMEQQLSDLRWRIQSLETKLSWKDEEKRFELAQVALEHILAVGEHLDGKASRILGAMAFLTAAAAAAIFARAWSPPLPIDDISRKLSVGLEPVFPQLTDEGRTALALQVAAGLAPVRPFAMLYAFTDGWRDGKRYKGRIACWVTLAVLWSVLGVIGGIRLAS